MNLRLPGMNRPYSPLYYPGVAGPGVEAWYRKGYEPCMVNPFHSPANADNRTRTCNPMLVRHMLSQLSYISIVVVNRIELILTAHQTVFLPLKYTTMFFMKPVTRFELATLYLRDRRSADWSYTGV